MDSVVSIKMTRRRVKTPRWRLLPVAMLAPAVVISVLFFVIPMIAVVANSLTGSGSGWNAVSVAAYISVITDEFYWDVMLRTVRIGLMTTVASLIFGYPAALYLYFSSSRWRHVLLFIIISPLFVSVIVRTYGWIIVLSPNGALNAFLPDADKLRLLQTNIAIVIGLTHIYIPFMILSLNTSLSRVEKRLLNAAATLGASPLQMFRDILLPLSLPGLISGCIIVFSISMTAFTTPILLGGAKNKTMAYLIYQQILLLANWPLGSALAVLLLIITVSLVYIVTRVGGKVDPGTLPS